MSKAIAGKVREVQGKLEEVARLLSEIASAGHDSASLEDAGDKLIEVASSFGQFRSELLIASRAEEMGVQGQ